MASMQGKGILGAREVKILSQGACIGWDVVLLFCPELIRSLPSLDTSAQVWRFPQKAGNGCARALPSTSQPCTGPGSSPLQMSSAEEAPAVARSIPRTSAEHSQHSPPSAAPASGRREEGKQLLPSHKTRGLLAWKVKWLCRKMSTRESCPRWPDVNWETQKHLPGGCSSSSEMRLCRASFCSSQQLLSV